ncbi:hypothetical protein PISL3812_07287 [Talaromyces islandicus]|uniref:Fungal-type protein kinase domain-containing protein n=1 Tax=Talaromyces islandicus TaxID=28573 RepID=A0A0U1M3Y9_TALIS|nr:hypothetical protein PISL3812_07287 [Talaromyces islandicus]
MGPIILLGTVVRLNVFPKRVVADRIAKIRYDRGNLVMADDAQARIIEENPIGSGLDVFLPSFNSFCGAGNLSCTSDALSRLTRDGKILALIVTDWNSGRSGVKRSSSQTGASLPPNKRFCSAPPTGNSFPNRAHRRVVLRDYGKPIYKASTRGAVLTSLEGCIAGHQSLQQAGIPHQEMPANNLMINEDEENPTWPSFLVDLDLVIREQRNGASGADGKAGTRAIMAIGSLLVEKNSFMHDLESFFWMIF